MIQINCAIDIILQIKMIYMKKESSYIIIPY